ADGVSPSVSTSTFVTSIVVFVAIYGVMAIIDTVLMISYARRPIPPTPEPGEGEASSPEMSY
ncbi:MAG TPA: cytochrome ubiquinol oxidase subunit I, partial [Thermoleophilia bacterium]|nr:cytochrome ubiquinol oxidase subunit I [Thermoleophilia bacterium]